MARQKRKLFYPLQPPYRHLACRASIPFSDDLHKIARMHGQNTSSLMRKILADFLNLPENREILGR